MIFWINWLLKNDHILKNFILVLQIFSSTINLLPKKTYFQSENLFLNFISRFCSPLKKYIFPLQIQYSFSISVLFILSKREFLLRISSSFPFSVHLLLPKTQNFRIIGQITFDLYN